MILAYANKVVLPRIPDSIRSFSITYLDIITKRYFSVLQTTATNYVHIYSSSCWRKRKLGCSWFSLILHAWSTSFVVRNYCNLKTFSYAKVWGSSSWIKLSSNRESVFRLIQYITHFNIFWMRFTDLRGYELQVLRSLMIFDQDSTTPASIGLRYVSG